jgi:hypothetical protein
MKGAGDSVQNHACFQKWIASDSIAGQSTDFFTTNTSEFNLVRIPTSSQEVRKLIPSPKKQMGMGQYL